MRPVLIDTDILSLFLRNNREVVGRFKSYLAMYKNINISIISYYEIISGLKHRDADKKMNLFLSFAAKNRLVPLTEQSVSISAEIYAELRKEGKPLDDIDLLIAGTAVANNLVLVTRNQSHFKRIKGLELEDWSAA
ncbi:MAG: type II toxin-antitoxin system VapC family toxin [Candidatus Electronema sp. V4]|uniref:PIN domain-containing protein n=1 Tax=Candidatus Electronema sp. V4 TaxID=3454756 RepID=UPI0040555A8B